MKRESRRIERATATAVINAIRPKVGSVGSRFQRAWEAKMVEKRVAMPAASRALAVMA
jgi:hypothetical protein